MFNTFLLKTLIPSKYLRSRHRIKIINKFGGKIASSSELRPGIKLNSYHLNIGKKSFINQDCSLYTGYEHAKITLGRNVYLGMEVLITCISHSMGENTQRAGNNIYAPVTIEDGAWIGARVTILPGVVIAKGCVIAAGSVVNKSTDPNCLYGGISAKKIKELN